jgi:hypothetical protein
VQEVAERLCRPPPGPVGGNRLLQRRRHGPQELPHLVAQRLHLGRERDLRDRQAAPVGVQLQAVHPSPGVHDPLPADLLPVVVVRGHPEDRDRWHIEQRFELVGEPRGGKRLRHRVDGAAEEAGLLAGGHHYPALPPEALQPSGGGRRDGAHQIGRATSGRRVEPASREGCEVAEILRAVEAGGVETPRISPVRQVVPHQRRAAEGAALDLDHRALPRRITRGESSSSGAPS